MSRRKVNARRSNGGYTLSETLIVLVIFVLLISISPNLYPSFTKGMENRLFISRFHEDLFHAQQYAISHESLIYLQIDNNKKVYTILSYKEGIVLERSIPKDIQFLNGTLGFSFHFNQFGNASKAGTMIIDTSKGQYKLVLNIGKGRFRIEKL
ncbi:competence type IV pilus minor pilin ComGD [Peribacillus sp. RS7]|uniref:competence type IV pilus minor pilin ComGD n=1 Tax=Peribacillus TaxID=2675229 RepID=UPI0025A02E05|nr:MULTISPECIES: competence type IV pilus minor pilin ComGD [unclassified Peribacillus]MDM5211714.1 competence type IV pilus minor pilin ComGD [Peribacillus sp. NJ4]MDM5222006.1 competence type IV pilus minor pilin ComGD [Peribacillus sp. NJ11]